jgi:hypothetical protein
MAKKMVAVVSNNATASGHAGTPPITTIELIEKSRTAQSRTNPSTSIEKLRSENLNHAHATIGAADTSTISIACGSTKIGAWEIGENVSSFSLAAAKIESRPDNAADENICTSNQSRKARRTRAGTARNSIPACPLGSAHATRPRVSTRTRGKSRSNRKLTSCSGRKAATA